MGWGVVLIWIVSCVKELAVLSPASLPSSTTVAPLTIVKSTNAVRQVAKILEREGLPIHALQKTFRVGRTQRPLVEIDILLGPQDGQYTIVEVVTQLHHDAKTEAQLARYQDPRVRHQLKKQGYPIKAVWVIVTRPTTERELKRHAQKQS